MGSSNHAMPSGGWHKSRQWSLLAIRQQLSDLPLVQVDIQFEDFEQVADSLSPATELRFEAFLAEYEDREVSAP